MAKRFLIVNYHYVEDQRDDRKGIWPCAVDEFERQIKYLSENYKIVSVGDVYEAAQRHDKNKFAAITFDDGLKDQYQNAIPILKKYGATAAFFPITGTLDGKYIPATHKIHLLLSRFDIKELINQFIKSFPQYYIPTDGSRINKERRLFEEANIANFKERLLSVPLPLKKEFLGSLRLEDEEQSVRELFLSRDELKELGKEGFAVGCHSHLHDAFLNGDDDGIKKDVRMSKSILAEILGVNPLIFSYPNGRYNDSVIRVLKNEGFKYAFDIEARAVEKGDDPFKIPRLDTNDIKKMIQ